MIKLNTSRSCVRDEVMDEILSTCKKHAVLETGDVDFDTFCEIILGAGDGLAALIAGLDVSAADSTRTFVKETVDELKRRIKRRKQQ